MPPHPKLDAKTVKPIEKLPSVPLYGYSVPCSHLAILAMFAEKHDIRMGPLLLEHGLSINDINASGATLAASEYTQILLSVDNCANDDGFWFHFASELDFPAYDILGQVLLSSDTLRQALRLLTKYYPLLSCGSALACSETDDAISLNVFREGDIQSRANVVRSELLAALVFNGISKVLPDRGAKLKFEFDYSKPKTVGVYHRYLNTNCRFSAEQSRIEVPAEYLQQPGIFPNPALLEILTKQCDAMLQRMSGCPSLGAQVRNTISAIPGHYPSARIVAQKIGLSARTMNRRLKSQGTSFQALTNEVKARRAVNFLRTTNMSIEEVTTAMGYSDSANFRRAFVRWTGILPSNYKKLS